MIEDKPKPDPKLISYIEKGFTPEILPDSWLGKLVKFIKEVMKSADGS